MMSKMCLDELLPPQVIQEKGPEYETPEQRVTILNI